MKRFESKETEFGILKYRMPDIDDAMFLFGEMGVSIVSGDSDIELDEETQKLKETKQNWQYIGGVIRGMGDLLDFSDLKKDEKPFATYRDLLGEFSLMSVMSEIAADILVHMTPQGEKVKKKTTSRKRPSSGPKA